jgi:Spy/CpxP family protein refolding chaperone
MKKVSSYFKVLAAAGMLTGLVQMTAAQPGYGRGPEKRGFERQEACPRYEQCPRLMAELTEEQDSQISVLKTAHLKDVQPLKGEININEAKIDALIIQDDPDVKALLSLIEENGRLRTEIRKKKVMHQLEIRKLLTDEQKVAFIPGPGPRHLRMPDRDCRFGDF